MPRRGWLALALALVTVAVYARTVRHGYISLDDPRYVSHNPVVARGLTADGVHWAFANGSYASNWHPLTWLSHMLDVELFGLERPGAQHAVDVALHVVAAILLLLALDRLTGQTWPSAWVAALFALHPLHVESVAWIAERKDVLSGLFWMATLWAWASYVERPGGRRYGLVLSTFALGLLAKPVLVTLPCVLLLLDYWPLERYRRRPGPSAATATGWPRLVAEKLPLFALAAASSLATYLAQRRALYSAQHLDLGDRLANAAVAYAAYLGKLFWPTDLAVFYPHPNNPGQIPLGTGTVVGAVALLVVATVLVGYGTLRGKRYLAVGWLWFLGTLVPMIGLVQVGSAAMADRYTYLPATGIFLLVAWSGCDWAATHPRSRRILTGAAAAAVLGCSLVTWRQVGYWRNDQTLFEHAIAVTERNSLAHTALGVAYANHGQRERAKQQLETAVALDPSEIDARTVLAGLLVDEGRHDAALALVGEALRLDPRSSRGHLNAGRAWAGKGLSEQAIAELERCLRSSPSPRETVQAHTLLAEELGRLGRLREAVGQYEALLRLEPDSPWALNNLAWILATRPGLLDPGRALALARRLSDLSAGPDPNHLDTLAAAWAASGDFTRAVATAERALRLVPPDANEQRAGIAARLALYQRGQPYLESPI